MLCAVQENTEKVSTPSKTVTLAERVTSTLVVTPRNESRGVNLVPYYTPDRDKLDELLATQHRKLDENDGWTKRLLEPIIDALYADSCSLLNFCKQTCSDTVVQVCRHVRATSSHASTPTDADVIHMISYSLVLQIVSVIRRRWNGGDTNSPPTPLITRASTLATLFGSNFADVYSSSVQPGHKRIPPRTMINTLEVLRGISSDLMGAEMSAPDASLLVIENASFPEWVRVTRDCLRTVLSKAGHWNDVIYQDGPPDTGTHPFVLSNPRSLVQWIPPRIYHQWHMFKGTLHDNLCNMCITSAGDVTERSPTARKSLEPAFYDAADDDDSDGSTDPSSTDDDSSSDESEPEPATASAAIAPPAASTTVNPFMAPMVASSEDKTTPSTADDVLDMLLGRPLSAKTVRKLWDLLGQPIANLYALTDASRLAGPDGETLIESSKVGWGPLKGCKPDCRLCTIPCKFKGCNLSVRVVIMQSDNPKFNPRFEACAATCPAKHRVWTTVAQWIDSIVAECMKSANPTASIVNWLNHAGTIVQRGIMCHVAGRAWQKHLRENGGKPAVLRHASLCFFI